MIERLPGDGLTEWQCSADSGVTYGHQTSGVNGPLFARPLSLSPPSMSHANFLPPPSPLILGAQFDKATLFGCEMQSSASGALATGPDSRGEQGSFSQTFPAPASGWTRFRGDTLLLEAQGLPQPTSKNFGLDSMWKLSHRGKFQEVWGLFWKTPSAPELPRSPSVTFASQTPCHSVIVLLKVLRKSWSVKSLNMLKFSGAAGPPQISKKHAPRAWAPLCGFPPVAGVARELLQELFFGMA